MSINVKEIAIKFIALVLAVAFLLPGNILANKEQKEIDQIAVIIKRSCYSASFSHTA